MKKQMKIAVILLSIIFIIISCKNSTDSGPDTDPNQIRLLKTELGGCNDEITPVKIAIEEDFRDTVITSFENGTLIIDAGLNYVCCAPFTTDCKVSNDSIFINISDMCPDIYKCYCKCNCYYTFRFSFHYILKKEYFYRIILNDPRVGNEILFKEGVFKNG
ncbi:MAG: hypothetical protein RO257_02330 [Candidatus Kapabacteria bacterium]|jgi:hypothetical protein|nr:hypothetical protein [Candidatus Kapabacteria bacterium]